MDKKLASGITEILQSAALPIQCAYVFGSIAKNTAKPNSDIDLAVLCEKLDIQEKMRLWQRITEITGRAVDWVDLKNAGTVITLEALNSKRLIGTDEQHAQLLARTLIDAGDFGVLRERILSERRELGLMNKQVIENKLESLRRCIERVAIKTPSSAAELVNDFDAQDVIVLNLSRAVQLTVDVGSHIISESKFPAPTSMREFSLHYREPRVGRNPKTGESVELCGKYVPRFKLGEELRVNGSGN